MRLIDADALLKDVRQDKALSACLGDIVDVQLLVVDQPTIDAVPVVRCKDCRGGNTTIVRKEGRFLCERLSRWVFPDDYCSCGERREDV